jgi:uncharacterized protein with HEPN domain
VRDRRERILDILEAIERIEKYGRGGREEFETNELVQIWILHYLQILGEAVNALRSGLQQSHPEIPWGSIVGMRNVLVHQYFSLARIGQLQLLPDLFEEIVVPAAMFQEVTGEPNLPGALAVRDARWLRTVEVSNRVAVEAVLLARSR